MTTCSPAVNTGNYVVGEKPAPLEYQYLDADGVPINLTGYTAKFVYREIFGAETVADATVTDAVAGKVTYVWDGSELTTSGDYRAYFWVGNNTNRFASVLITWNVAYGGTVPNI
jgi:hypothetical protein